MTAQTEMFSEKLRLTARPSSAAIDQTTNLSREARDFNPPWVSNATASEDHVALRPAKEIPFVTDRLLETGR